MAQAVGLSLLLHFLLLLLAFFSKTEPAQDPIEVAFLPPEQTLAPQREQIVSPSETTPQAPKVETNLRSDKDSSTEMEQIKRGLPGSSSPPAKRVQPQQEQKPVKQTPPKNEAKSAAKLETKSAQKDSSQAAKASPPTLRLGAGSLLEKLEKKPSPEEETNEARLQALVRGKAPPQKTEASDTSREQQLREYQPFRPSSIDSLFSTRSGSADYLPTVQDGEVTLLNAKADRHAIFVRRVALQVFGALRKQSWSEISYSRLKHASNFITVYATMSAEGNLLSVNVRDGSGSSIFDKVVESAVRTGTWDQNPPAGALAEDGTIRFVFKSKTWARRVGDARREQRWLLLSTGLL